MLVKTLAQYMSANHARPTMKKIMLVTKTGDKIGTKVFLENTVYKNIFESIKDSKNFIPLPYFCRCAEGNRGIPYASENGLATSVLTLVEDGEYAIFYEVYHENWGDSRMKEGYYALAIVPYTPEVDLDLYETVEKANWNVGRNQWLYKINRYENWEKLPKMTEQEMYAFAKAHVSANNVPRYSCIADNCGVSYDKNSITELAKALGNDEFVLVEYRNYSCGWAAGDNYYGIAVVKQR